MALLPTVVQTSRLSSLHMDLLHISVSLPPSTRVGFLGRGIFSKEWRNNEVLQSSTDFGQVTCKYMGGVNYFHSSRKETNGLKLKRNRTMVPRSTDSSSSSDTLENQEETSDTSKAPFGYTRKDVLLIGLGVTAIGVGLKYGLEFLGVDPLQAGNVVQLVLVLGLTIGWISTYIFRVSNKDMTYAKQLRDYEKKVMEKRLEGLTEAELEALLEQVEEEKRRLTRGNQVK